MKHRDIILYVAAVLASFGSVGAIAYVTLRPSTSRFESEVRQRDTEIAALKAALQDNNKKLERLADADIVPVLHLTEAAKDALLDEAIRNKRLLTQAEKDEIYGTCPTCQMTEEELCDAGIWTSKCPPPPYDPIKDACLVKNGCAKALKKGYAEMLIGAPTKYNPHGVGCWIRWSDGEIENLEMNQCDCNGGKCDRLP